MDFIARAGKVLDRAYRLAGLLLVLLVAESLLLMNYVNENADLNKKYEELRNRLWVYVVPGGLAGMYAPTQDRMLLNSFASLITQSLHSYTFENLAMQYKEAKKFFSHEMLQGADDHFGNIIKTADIDQRSSLFVPSSLDTVVQVIKDERGKDTDTSSVTLYGDLKQIIAGSVVESIPLEITMIVRKTQISSSNPFGYTLVSYKYVDRNKNKQGRQ